MAKTITTEISIDAPVEAVWKSLVDLDGYQTWNPFFVKGSGTIRAPGEKLSLKLSNGSTITPTVKTVDHAKELRWEGAIVGNWFFGGSHYFQLEATSARVTKVIHGEQFYGIMPTVAPWFIHGIKKDYEKVNIALKQHCESSSSK